MDKFKEKLLKTLQLCNMELENRKKGIVGESTEEQLEEIIIPELKKLLEDIENNNQLPPKEKRYLASFALAFKVWGWNMQTPTEIFDLLERLDREYRNL